MFWCTSIKGYTVVAYLTYCVRTPIASCILSPWSFIASLNAGDACTPTPVTVATSASSLRSSASAYNTSLCMFTANMDGNILFMYRCILCNGHNFKYIFPSVIYLLFSWILFFFTYCGWGIDCRWGRGFVSWDAQLCRPPPSPRRLALSMSGLLVRPGSRLSWILWVVLFWENVCVVLFIVVSLYGFYLHCILWFFKRLLEASCVFYTLWNR